MATFAGRTILNASDLARQCYQLALPTDWIGKANRYENSLGHESGTGYILLLRADLDAIKINTPQDLVFEDGTRSLTLKGLHIVGTRCISPGDPGSKNAAHLVELADCRRYFKLTSVNVGYNLKTTPTGNYADFTTADGAGTPWDWQGVLDDLWSELPAIYAGLSPVLPATPNGTPDELAYHGWTAIDAIGDVLDRLGLALSLDITTGIFTYVQPGATQRKLAQLEKKWLVNRLFDLEPVSPSFGQVPSTVSVYFRKTPTRAYGNVPYVVSTIDAPTPLRTGEGGTLIIHDDLRATYQARDLANSAALQLQATARAVEFFRQRREFFAQPKQKVYSGILAGFGTGEETLAITYEDFGDTYGVRTVVSRLPESDPIADWKDDIGQPWRLSEVVEVIAAESGDPTPPAGCYKAQVVRRMLGGDVESLFSCWAWDESLQTPPMPPGLYNGIYQTFEPAQDDATDVRPVYSIGCCPVDVPGVIDYPGTGKDDGSDTPVIGDCCDAAPDTVTILQTVSNSTCCAGVSGKSGTATKTPGPGGAAWSTVTLSTGFPCVTNIHYGFECDITPGLPDQYFLGVSNGVGFTTCGGMSSTYTGEILSCAPFHVRFSGIPMRDGSAGPCPCGDLITAPPGATITVDVFG